MLGGLAGTIAQVCYSVHCHLLDETQSGVLHFGQHFTPSHNVVLHKPTSPSQGFAFGTGSAIAHRAVGAIAGSFSGDSNEAAPAAAGAAPAAPVAAAGPAKGAHCNDFQTQFVQCLREVRGLAEGSAGRVIEASR